MALELAVVPKYPSSGAPCWTEGIKLLLWAVRVLEGTTNGLKKKVRN